MTNFRITLEPWAGARIQNCCADAVKIARALSIDVVFSFNETNIIAHPDDDPDNLVTRWSNDYEANRPR